MTVVSVSPSPLMNSSVSTSRGGNSVIYWATLMLALSSCSSLIADCDGGLDVTLAPNLKYRIFQIDAVLIKIYHFFIL